MAADGSVTISITGDAKDLEEELKKIQDQLDETKKKEEQTGDSSFGSKISSGCKTAAKAAAGMAAALGSAVAALTVASVKSYSDYEQLVGGVETLFGTGGATLEEYAEQEGKTVSQISGEYRKLEAAQNQVFQNAASAYKTAGLNANEYMETVTSFSASLVSSLGGNAEAAAEKANLAVTDMSDNANKMGTDMSIIIATYQSLARGNYAMLDNLKLGYGGTKSELERLLSDAEKQSGKKYDISSFSDIIDAIHAVQDELGITGTTADEAATTIEGSANSMKAAWQNVLTGLADENQDIGTLLDEAIASTMTFGDNVIPRIQQTLEGIGEAFEILVPTIMTMLPSAAAEILPGVVSAVASLVTSVGSTIMQYGSEIAQSATELLGQLADGIRQNLPQIIPAAMETLVRFSESLRENIGYLVDAGLELIMALAEGLIDGIPTFIEAIPEIITNLAGIINDNAPKLLLCGLELLGALAEGLIQAIPVLIANLPQILQAILAVFSAFNWVSLGTSIVTGIQTAMTSLPGVLKTIGQNALTAFKSINWANAGTAVCNFIHNAIAGAGGLILSALRSVGTNGLNAFRSINWASVGKAAVNFIATAARGAGGLVMSALRSVGTNAMSAFRSINWASLGRNIISGIVSGITGAASNLYNTLTGLASQALSAAKNKLKINSPSKVFRDEVGVSIPEGMGAGVEKAAPGFLERVKALSGGALDAAKSMLLSDNVDRGISTAYTTNSQTANNDNSRNVTVNNTFQSPKALNRKEIARQERKQARRLKALVA